MKQRKTKPKRYTRWSKRIERNILAVWNQANDSDRSEGMHWYQRAHEHAVKLAERYRVSVPQTIGVIAALSPGNAWGRNLQDADTLLSAWGTGERGNKLPNVGSYGRRNIEKCARILDGVPSLAVLGGDKVRAFYATILDPTTANETVIDRHARSLAYAISSAKRGAASTEKEAAVRSSAEYRYLARHYATLADRLDILPHQLQAVTWVAWKRLGEQKEPSAPF